MLGYVWYVKYADVKGVENFQYTLGKQHSNIRGRGSLE